MILTTLGFLMPDSLYIYIYIYIVILSTNPSARAGYDTRSIFKRSLTGFNSDISFPKTSCLTKAEEPRVSYYLPIAGERIIEFIPFPRVLVLREIYIYIYIYSYPQADLFRSIRTLQCG